MKKGYNKVIFVGYIGSRPELRRTPQGVAVGTFSLCVPKRREKEEDVVIDIVAFRTLAEESGSALTTGQTVLVEGTLAPYRWNKAASGQPCGYEVRAATISILE